MASSSEETEVTVRSVAIAWRRASGVGAGGIGGGIGDGMGEMKMDGRGGDGCC